MKKFIVCCFEKVQYEVEVEAETAFEAGDKVKDNLPNYEDAVDSEFDGFEVFTKEEYDRLYRT